jgi:hypothetical protein
METILNSNLYLGTIFAIVMGLFVFGLGVWVNKDEKKHTTALG